MQMITAIRAQRRNKERVNIHLNGEYAFSLALITAARLSIGQSLSPEEIGELKSKDTIERAKQSAFRYISYRPRSKWEVRRNLKQKEFDEEVIELVVNRLSELEMLDDAEFARFWVEQRESFKPRSRMALRQELYQKGVNREIIDAAVENINEHDAARRAASKKAIRWSQLPKKEYNLKVYQYLQRRGFNYEICASVAEELWQEMAVMEEENDAG